MSDFMTVMIIVFGIALTILTLGMIGCLLKADTRREELLEHIKDLESQRIKLNTENNEIIMHKYELQKLNENLTRRAEQLREELRDDERDIRQMETRIDAIKSTKEGLEIALYDMPVEEVHYLSKGIFCMGLTRSVQSHLESNGIQYIGDLIPLSEEHLTEIWGIGPVTLERIKSQLAKNEVWFGMDVIRVNNQWFRRKQEDLTD